MDIYTFPSIPHLLNIHALNVHTNVRVKAQLIHTPKIQLRVTKNPRIQRETLPRSL